MRRLKGKTLVGRAIDAAELSGACDLVVVLTDDVDAMAIAKRRDVQCLKEPQTLSAAEVYPVQACAWALEAYGGRCAWDAVVCLYPSVPLRLAEDVRTCVKALGDWSLDTVLTVTKAEAYHNALAIASGNDGLEPIWGDWIDLRAPDIADLMRVVIPNGAVIAVRADRLASDVSWFRGPKLFGHPIPWHRGLNVRSEEDLKVVELFATNGPRSA